MSELTFTNSHTVDVLESRVENDETTINTLLDERDMLHVALFVAKARIAELERQITATRPAPRLDAMLLKTQYDPLWA